MILWHIHDFDSYILWLPIVYSGTSVFISRRLFLLMPLASVLALTDTFPTRWLHNKWLWGASRRSCRADVLGEDHGVFTFTSYYLLSSFIHLTECNCIAFSILLLYLGIWPVIVFRWMMFYFIFMSFHYLSCDILCVDVFHLYSVWAWY